jgi:cellulose/xylan binding protein with CBM9 domain
MKTLSTLTIAAVLIIMSTVCMADEIFFFWYGSTPDSVSWAPFDWEEQGRASGFATSVEAGEFWNHTEDAEDEINLNRSLVFGLDSMGNIGAHHPTVLPGGVGTVSLWVYFDIFGFAMDDSFNTVYLSVQPGSDLVKDSFIGIEMPFNGSNFNVVSSENPRGADGATIKEDDWNHFMFFDNGSETKVLINNEVASVTLPSGGNLWYINIVDGRVQSDGSITDGESVETWYFDDILCTSQISSGVEFIDAPLTSNNITIDGEINADEIAGANSKYWDGTSPERPGVHAQFYGQWALPTEEDLNATVYLQNDGTNLYISIDVVDDIVFIGESASWWEEDSTEIYIDHDNSRSTSGSDQISIRADNGVGNAGDFADWLTIESKVKSGDLGWQVEAMVDMAARELSQDQTYGFDISINDSDGENEAGYQGAQEWLYASYEFAYSNETYWGNIRILSEATRVLDWDIY